MKKLRIAAIVILSVIVIGILASHEYAEHQKHQKGLAMINLVLDTPFGSLVIHNLTYPNNSAVMVKTVRNFEPRNDAEEELQIVAMAKIIEMLEESILFLEEFEKEQEEIPLEKTPTKSLT